MSLQKTRSALIAAYNAAGLNLPTAHENRAFQQPTDGAAWASVFIVPAGISPLTLGDAGQDEATGFMQVDVNVQGGKGTTTALGYADALREAFKAGQRLVYDGQQVIVRRTEVSRLRRSDTGGEFVVTVTVYWEARYNR